MIEQHAPLESPYEGTTIDIGQSDIWGNYYLGATVRVAGTAFGTWTDVVLSKEDF